MFKPAVGPKVESDAGDPASPKAPAVPTKETIANGLKPSCKHKGTYIAAIIGMVENDEPIPRVSTKPTSSRIRIAKGLLLANHEAELSTNKLIIPICSNTSAKPASEIIIKPMDAIILIPSANTPSDLFQSTTPVAVNTKKPAMAPTTIDPVYNCIKNVIKIATIATANAVVFFSFGGSMFVGISTGSYCLFLP